MSKKKVDIPFLSWRRIGQREIRDSELYNLSECSDSHLSHRYKLCESSLDNSVPSLSGDNFIQTNKQETQEENIGIESEDEVLTINTNLKDAILEKNPEAAEFCLRNGADVNSQFGSKKISALHLAIYVGVMETINTLLESGADVKMTDSQGVTPLHLAAGNGLTNLVPRLITAGADINAHDSLKKNGKGHETPLHRAAAGGHLEVLKQLISSGALVNICDVKRRTPLQYAVFMGRFDSAEYLLENGADIHILDTEGDTVLHACALKGHACILKLLLSQPKAEDIVNSANYKGRMPLHKAAYRGSAKCIQLLLRAGADLGAQNKTVSSATRLILQLPNGVNTLMNTLNESIVTNGMDPSEVCCKVTFDYSVLLSKHREQQMGIIKDIIDHPREQLTADLIRHPVIESFLCLKWRKIRFLFFLDVFLYMIFMAGVTAYILSAVSSKTSNDNIPKDLIHITNSTIQELETNKKHYIVKEEIVWVTQASMIIFIPIIIILEIIQCATLKLRYFSRFESWIKFFALISSTVVIFSTPPWPEWVHEISAVAVLLGWSEVTFLLGRLPTFGVYALMFYSVAKNLMKFIVAYVFFLAGFSFSFYLTFTKKKDSFYSPWTSFLRTLSMMLGDHEFDEYLTGDNYNLHEMAYVIYFCFLVLVSLILMNLLIGLAVNDIQGLQKEGRVERLRKQAEFIIYLEDIASNRFICWIPSWCTKLTERINTWITIEPVYTFSPAGRKLKGFLPSSIVARTVAIVKSNPDSVESATGSQTYTLLQDCVTSIESLRFQMESLERGLNEILTGNLQNSKEKKSKLNKMFGIKMQNPQKCIV